VKYAIRLVANDSLERDIAELLPRAVGRRLSCHRFRSNEVRELVAHQLAAAVGENGRALAQEIATPLRN